MTKADRIRSDLQVIAETAAKARQDVASGDVVDLRSLETLVERMTSAPGDLTAEESDELRKALLVLVAELDELRELVRSEHETIRGQLEGSGARRSATAAYGQLPPRRR